MLGLLYISQLPKPLHSFPVHKHECWEIVYYTNGCGQLTIKESVFDFEPGDIYCIPPEMEHSEISKEGFQNIHYWVKILPGFSKVPVSFHDTLSKDFYTILKKMYNEYYLKRNNWVNITESLLDALFQYMISWNSEKGEPLIDRMKGLIIRNLSNPNFQLKDIYDDIPMSPDHLRKLFKEQTSKNPLQYLSELRIEFAKNMLEHIYPHGLTIKEIAAMCGFSDPYYFSRAFKKITGKSPSEWTKSV